jgi:hypothetical protein
VRAEYEKKAMLSWELETHVRGVRSVPSHGERKDSCVDCNPSLHGRLKTQLRGLKPVLPLQVETGPHVVQPVSTRYSETQLRGVQPVLTQSSNSRSPSAAVAVRVT